MTQKSSVYFFTQFFAVLICLYHVPLVSRCRICMHMVRYLIYIERSSSHRLGGPTNSALDVCRRKGGEQLWIAPEMAAAVCAFPWYY